MGIWAVLHEVRSEYAQLLTVAFLAVNGPGRWSLDALMRRRSPRPAAGFEAEVPGAPVAIGARAHAAVRR